MPNPKKREFRKDLKECLALAKKKKKEIFNTRLLDEDIVTELRKRISYERDPGVVEFFKGDIKRFESEQEMKSKFAAFYEKYSHDKEIVREYKLEDVVIMRESIAEVVEHKKPGHHVFKVFGWVVIGTLGASLFGAADHFLKDLTGTYGTFGRFAALVSGAIAVVMYKLIDSLDPNYDILIEELKQIDDAKKREERLQNLKEYNKKHGWGGYG